MAEKVYINGDKEKLKAFFESLTPEYFSSVQLTDDTTYEIECLDSDENVLFVFKGTANGNGAPTAFIKSGESAGATTTTSVFKFDYGYKCKCGALLVGTSTQSSGVLITKNNLGKTVFVIGGSASNNNNLAANVSVLTWDDVPPINIDLLGFTKTDGNLVVPVPFVTKCALGTISYTLDACYMPISSTREIGTVKLDGIDYVTNGVWAVRDE